MDKKEPTFDELTAFLDALKIEWDAGHTGRLREARVWSWPSVIGRYRPTENEPPSHMLAMAMKDAGIEYETII